MRVIVVQEDDDQFDVTDVILVKAGETDEQAYERASKHLGKEVLEWRKWQAFDVTDKMEE